MNRPPDTSAALFHDVADRKNLTSHDQSSGKASTNEEENSAESEVTHKREIDVEQWAGSKASAVEAEELDEAADSSSSPDSVDADGEDCTPRESVVDETHVEAADDGEVLDGPMEPNSGLEDGADEMGDLARATTARQWRFVADKLTSLQCSEITNGWRVITGTLKSLQYLQCRRHKDCQHMYRKKYDKESDSYSLAEAGTHSDLLGNDDWKVVSKAASAKEWMDLTEEYVSRGGTKRFMVSSEIVSLCNCKFSLVLHLQKACEVSTHV